MALPNMVQRIANVKVTSGRIRRQTLSSDPAGRPGGPWGKPGNPRSQMGIPFSGMAPQGVTRPTGRLNHKNDRPVSREHRTSATRAHDVGGVHVLSVRAVLAVVESQPPTCQAAGVPGRKVRHVDRPIAVGVLLVERIAQQMPVPQSGDVFQ